MKATALKQLLTRTPAARMFSAGGGAVDIAKLHEKKHSGSVMDPKYYEEDYVMGRTEEMEFVRSPYYDLAK